MMKKDRELKESGLEIVNMHEIAEKQEKIIIGLERGKY